mmetsp:Transcript_28954/g.95225  ORF Transcript_28954/g.95225 Transcript_28954/m.95225 type:complete len:452 (+) Transcript_28954:1298-2653(+)
MGPRRPPPPPRPPSSSRGRRKERRRAASDSPEIAISRRGIAISRLFHAVSPHLRRCICHRVAPVEPAGIVERHRLGVGRHSRRHMLLRRRRLLVLGDGVQREEEKQPRVADPLERCDCLAEEQRGREHKPSVARHRDELQRDRRRPLHEQKRRNVHDEPGEGRREEQQRNLAHKREGAGLASRRDLLEQRHGRHEEQAGRRGVHKRLERAHLLVLEQLLRNHEPERIRARRHGHKEHTDERKVDLARRSDARAHRQPEYAPDDAVGRPLHAEAKEEADHVRRREGLQHLDEGHGQVKVRVLAEHQRQRRDAAEHEQRGGADLAACLEALARDEDDDGGAQGGGNLPHRRHHHRVSEALVLHQDLVGHDGHGGGDEVEHRVQQRHQHAPRKEPLRAVREDEEEGEGPANRGERPEIVHYQVVKLLQPQPLRQRGLAPVDAADARRPRHHRRL